VRSLKSSFFLAMAVGVAAVILWNVVDRVSAPSEVVPRQLADGIWVSEQVTPEQLPAFKARDIKAVIDLRPDGEVPDQPSSNVMADAAAKAGLQFAYIPVAHSDAPPAAAVDALVQSLAKLDKPVLLYCRSGRRAVRTWALAEASRAGGLDTAAIEEAAKAAGQTTDGLHDMITARVAARAKAP
jgi:uncharacterized protein (TIGR01244 family)